MWRGISTATASAHQRLFQRQMAFKLLFLDEGGMTLKPEARIVMQALERFCGATATTVRTNPVTGAVDPIALALAEGRRQALLFIAAQISADPNRTLTEGVLEEAHV